MNAINLHVFQRLFSSSSFSLLLVLSFRLNPTILLLFYDNFFVCVRSLLEITADIISIVIKSYNLSAHLTVLFFIAHLKSRGEEKKSKSEENKSHHIPIYIHNCAVWSKRHTKKSFYFYAFAS
jgi:hypothetical protein